MQESPCKSYAETAFAERSEQLPPSSDSLALRRTRRSLSPTAARISRSPTSDLAAASHLDPRLASAQGTYRRNGHARGRSIRFSQTLHSLSSRARCCRWSRSASTTRPEYPVSGDLSPSAQSSCECSRETGELHLAKCEHRPTRRCSFAAFLPRVCSRLADTLCTHRLISNFSEPIW